MKDAHHLHKCTIWSWYLKKRSFFFLIKCQNIKPPHPISMKNRIKQQIFRAHARWRDFHVSSPDFTFEKVKRKMKNILNFCERSQY
jgi:hypothetical protein